MGVGCIFSPCNESALSFVSNIYFIFLFFYFFKNQQRPFDDHTKEETSSKVFLEKYKQRAWALAPTPHIDFYIVGKHRNPCSRWDSKDSEAIWLRADFGRMWQFSTALDNFWQILAVFRSLDKFWQILTVFSRFGQIVVDFPIFGYGWQVLLRRAENIKTP
jgi:hypothetical protein